MSDEKILSELRATVKSYPDFPKKGIIFRDFFPILQNPQLFDGMICLFQKWLSDNSKNVDCIVGLDSRGFLLGPSLSLKLDVPFVPVRKAGKLPGNCKKQTYGLEYGSDAVEIQIDSIKEGQKVIIIDDLLATGGTMEAAVKLVKSVGGIVEHCLVVIELEDLKGKMKVPAPVYSLFQF